VGYRPTGGDEAWMTAIAWSGKASGIRRAAA
jgi:hypothetical protein